MASAQSDIHNRAIHHLEDYEDCSLPTQDECTDAYVIFNGDDITNMPYNYTRINSLLDTLCSEACIEVFGDNMTVRDHACLKQNNQYCLAIKIVGRHLCETLNDNSNKSNVCTDGASYCLDFFVNDLSCCLEKWENMGIVDKRINTTTIDVCGNHYNYCNNSTCAPNSTCAGANCTAADPTTNPTTDPIIHPSPTIEPLTDSLVSVSTTVTVYVAVVVTCAGANCTAVDPTTNPTTDPTIDPSLTIDPAISRTVSVSTAVTAAVVVAIVAAALPLIVMAVIVFIRKTSRKHLVPDTT